MKLWSCGSWKKNQLWIRSSVWCTFLTAACEITFKAGEFLWQQRTISCGGSRDVPADLHVVALRTRELRINGSFIHWLFDSPSIYLCFCPLNNVVSWNNKHVSGISEVSCVLIQVCLWLSVRLTCVYVMICWGLSLYSKMAPNRWIQPCLHIYSIYSVHGWKSRERAAYYFIKTFRLYIKYICMQYV